jgi:hypothetical protein
MRGGDLNDDIRRAFENTFDPNKNGLTESVRKSNEALANAFDPNKNGLATAVNSAVDAIKNVDWNQVKNQIGDSLDPAKNGVSEAFNKFGGDAKRAFEDLGQKIKESAERDKAVLDRAFAPLANEFTNPNSALSKFVASTGIPMTPDDWKKKFEDPQTYFTLLSLLVTAASTVVSAGVAGPGTFAAMQAIIASARVITKAAQGQPVGAGDIAGVVMAMVPGKAGPGATSWLNAAQTAGASLGGNLVKMAAKNVVTSNVAEMRRQNGETLANISLAATPAKRGYTSPNMSPEEARDRYGAAHEYMSNVTYGNQPFARQYTPEDFEGIRGKPDEGSEFEEFVTWMSENYQNLDNGYNTFLQDQVNAWRESKNPAAPPPPPPPPAEPVAEPAAEPAAAEPSAEPAVEAAPEPARVGLQAYEVGQLDGIENAPTTPEEYKSFNEFSDKPEYADTQDFDGLLIAWRNSLMAGSGKKRSRLLDHASTHLMKRSRGSYDERFFA